MIRLSLRPLETSAFGCYRQKLCISSQDIGPFGSIPEIFGLLSMFQELTGTFLTTCSASNVATGAEMFQELGRFIRLILQLLELVPSAEFSAQST